MSAEIIRHLTKSQTSKQRTFLNEYPYAQSARTSHHSIRGAAWVLGIATNDVCRAIRTGAIRVERRRSRLVIPDRELARLLAETSTSPPEVSHGHG